MDLFTGEEILISVDRGNDARGCRLDPAAFARITVWGQRALDEGLDLLVVNKFGKEEASGRGLRPVIGEALISCQRHSKNGSAGRSKNTSAMLARRPPNWDLSSDIRLGRDYPPVCPSWHGVSGSCSD